MKSNPRLPVIDVKTKKIKPKSSDPNSIRTTRQSSKLQETLERESSTKTRSMGTAKPTNSVSTVKRSETLKRKISLPYIEPNNKKSKSSQPKSNQKSRPGDQKKEK